MTDTASAKPKAYVAGSTGLVGSALFRRLLKGGYRLTGPDSRIDLTDQQATLDLLDRLRPDWVLLAAAKVGGIYANSTYPADFIYTNLMIQANVIHAAYLAGVKKLLFLGSACIYPKEVPSPIKEDYLLSGHLEPTNAPYAIAKIAGITMAQSYNKQYGTNFISVMPCNLYGPNDYFDLENSHVIPALIRKTHEAKKAGAEFMEIWGTGNPRREFLHVDDLADACVFLMENYGGNDLINIGYGDEVPIRDLAYLIREVVGYSGELRFNPQMPDGRPGGILDTSRLTALGWKPSISLQEGIAGTYRWYLEREKDLRK